MVAYMRQQMPSTQILILGILPRGSWTLDNPVQWPNRMTKAITAVNNASQARLLFPQLPLCPWHVMYPVKRISLHDSVANVMRTRPTIDEQMTRLDRAASV